MSSAKKKSAEKPAAGGRAADSTAEKRAAKAAAAAAAAAVAAPASLVVRPAAGAALNASKVYLARDTLRALGIDAGSFVAVGAGAIGVAAPAEVEADTVGVPRELRRAAGLALGDRIAPAAAARPAEAAAVRIYTLTDAAAEPVKDMLAQLAVVHVGQTFNGLTVAGLVRAPRAPAGLDLDLAKLNLDTPGAAGAAAAERGPLTVGAATKVVFVSEPPPPRPGPGYAQVGGLGPELAALRAKLELPLHRPELFERFATRPEKGVLLHGPPGTGKTLLLRAVAAEAEAHVVRVDGPALYSRYQGATEQSLRAVFEEARRFAPSIIFVDEIDALAPKRDSDDSGETESRVVATLLTLMDGMGAADRVVVVGATNRPNSVDPALRRPGRFGHEIEIGIPDARGRRAILDLHLAAMPHRLSDAYIEELANKTHGYVGADLEALSREAVEQAIAAGIRRALPAHAMFVEREHYAAAFVQVRPSAMREIFLETPKVKWSDIGGQERVIQQLREAVEWPLQHQQSFARLGITPPRGVLLYGPPGNSKTMLVKALATEAGLNFLAVKGPEVFNKYVGESERAVRDVFRRARATAPSIIFFDEIDALSVARGAGDGSSGDRVLTSLLNEMDGIEALNGVVIVAATNRPDVIDSALMRPGRLDRLIYVAPPDLAARRQILLIQLAKMAVDESVNLDALAARTDGCSGAEVVSICQEAGLLAMNEDVDIAAIRQDHFEAALSALRKQITPEQLEYFEHFSRGG